MEAVASPRPAPPARRAGGEKGGGGGGLWNRERSQSSLGIDADLTPINVVVNIFLNILFFASGEVNPLLHRDVLQSYTAV